MYFNTYQAYSNLPNDPTSFAASRSGQGAPGGASAGLLPALAQANGFTLEDLQTNRQGWMSSRQRAGVVTRMRGCLFLLGFFVVMLVGGIGVPIILGLGGSPLLLLLLVLPCLVVFALLARRPISRARKQLLDGRVAFIDGFVERERKESHASEGGTSISYAYVVYQPQATAVNVQRFSVNGAAFHALPPGLRYRIYYLPSDHQLVSIEPLP